MLILYQIESSFFRRAEFSMLTILAPLEILHDFDLFHYMLGFIMTHNEDYREWL